MKQHTLLHTHTNSRCGTQISHTPRQPHPLRKKLGKLRGATKKIPYIRQPRSLPGDKEDMYGKQPKRDTPLHSNNRRGDTARPSYNRRHKRIHTHPLRCRQLQLRHNAAPFTADPGQCPAARHIRPGNRQPDNR